MSSCVYDVAIIGKRTGCDAARAGRTSRGACRARKIPALSHRRIAVAVQHESFYPAAAAREIFARRVYKELRGEIMGTCSYTGMKFCFKDGDRSQTDHAYQVTRGDLDEVLLDHAGESGMEVHEQTLVEAVEFPNRGIAPESPQTGGRVS